MSLDIADAKRRLPLPDLLARFGLSAHAKKSARCPFHEDREPSFSVFQRDGLWRWKCHAGCGSGDEITFLEKLKGFTNTEAIRYYCDLARDNRSVADRPAVAPMSPKSYVDLCEQWRACVAAFDMGHLTALTQWRGYSVDFCQWLKRCELVGVHRGLVAFPVHGDGGAVIAFHVRTKDGSKWFYEPTGATVRPLVIGDCKTADTVFVFESQWDAFAVMDKLTWQKSALPGAAVIVTRGAGNGKLIRGMVKRGATVYAFKQNDQPDPKTGRIPGDDWLKDLTVAATADGATVKLVATPAPHKDANDWTRAGAMDKDVNAAIEAASVFQPLRPQSPQNVAEGKPSAILDTAIITSAEFQGMELEPREFVLRPFWKAGDLGFLYAPRGDGKTWLAMLMANAAANAGSAGPWKADKAWRVLYVDGEMPAEESRRRILALNGGGENLSWLHHEIFFERTGKTLNLADADTQRELTELLLARDVRVLVLDNLSCLFSGVKENDADSWEQVLPWLLRLRRLKIAVVIVAHAGRSGQNIRGTSRREDAAFWVLKLERNESDDPQFRGLRFTSLFTKNRNALEDDCPPVEWTIRAESNGTATVTTKPISGVELLVSWVRAGLESATDIAAEMGISKGQVSKLAKRAERLGEIVIEGRCYRPTETQKA